MTEVGGKKTFRLTKQVIETVTVYHDIDSVEERQTALQWLVDNGYWGLEFSIHGLDKIGKVTGGKVVDKRRTTRSLELIDKADW